MTVNKLSQKKRKESQQSTKETVNKLSQFDCAHFVLGQLTDLNNISLNCSQMLSVKHSLISVHVIKVKKLLYVTVSYT